MVDYRNDFAIEYPIPDPGRIIADRFERQMDYSVRRSKGSPGWLLFYTMDGRGTIRSGTGEIQGIKGNITIIKPGIPHDYFTSPNALWDFYWVYFSPRPAWHVHMELPEAEKGIISVDISIHKHRERIASVFERIVSDCQQIAYANTGQELALCGIEEILLLLRHELWQNSQAALDPRVVEVIEYLHQNYAEPISLKHLAEHIHLSATRLAHLYKYSTGESVLDTLHRVRLDKAAKLMSISSLSIAGIAEFVGYQSVNFFARKFRQQYGMSPSQFRQNRASLS